VSAAAVARQPGGLQAVQFLARRACETFPFRLDLSPQCTGGAAGWDMAIAGNEQAVLAGLTRALLQGGARSVPLAAIFEGCGRRIPVPVILEVMERLVAHGLVRRLAGGAEVVAFAVATGGAAPARASAAAAEENFAITEAGFLTHREAIEAEAATLEAELPARMAAEGMGAAERAAWAELHDYLSWRSERSVHLANFGLGHRIAGDALRRFQETLLRLGLLERAQAETHYRLTELGSRIRRLPSGDKG
jgi:hypothetical protein